MWSLSLLWWVWSLVGSQSSLGFSHITDKYAGILITSADVDSVDKGAVLKYFDSVLFSHRELHVDKGVMVFQPKSNVKGSLIPTRLRGVSHQFEPEHFIEKMRQIVGADHFGESVRFLGVPGNATDFGEGNILEWFLLEVEDPKDGESRFKPVAKSVLVQVGEMNEIRKLNETYLADPSLIYRKHFRSVPLQLSVFEGSPGVDAEDEPLRVSLTDFYLRSHTREQSGNIVIPSVNKEKGVENVRIPVCRVTYEADGIGLVFKADEFITEAISKRMERAPALVCSQADQGKEALTSCRKVKSNECGAGFVIEGKLVLEDPTTAAQARRVAPKPSEPTEEADSLEAIIMSRFEDEEIDQKRWITPSDQLRFLLEYSPSDLTTEFRAELRLGSQKLQNPTSPATK